MSFTLLNTRPTHQAQALSDLVVQHGGQVIECPTMAIHTLPDGVQSDGLPEKLDKVIFTSANAVHGLMQQRHRQKIWPLITEATLFAIGKATRRAGIEVGLKIQTLSDKYFDSEHLLAHPTMQQVAGERIALIKGQGGRTLIADTLSARGAQVIAWEVYHRDHVEFCTTAWQTFLKAKQPLLLITSLQSWQCLLAGCLQGGTQGDWDAISAAIVMSERIAQAMRADGWQRPIVVVATQGNDGIIQAISTFNTAVGDATSADAYNP